MRRLKLSELVIDFDVYPRAEVNEQHVQELRRAVESGAVLPPIVICAASRRVVDGFHRVSVYTDLYGSDHALTVVEKTYRNERELFLDAMRFNSAHGLCMDARDKAHCATMAAKLGIDDAALAGAIHVDKKRVGELRTNGAGAVLTVARKPVESNPISEKMHHAGQSLGGRKKDADYLKKLSRNKFSAEEMADESNADEIWKRAAEIRAARHASDDEEESTEHESPKARTMLSGDKRAMRCIQELDRLIQCEMIDSDETWRQLEGLTNLIRDCKPIKA